MDILSVVVLLILIAWFYFAIRYMMKNHKSGKCGSCSGNCTECNYPEKRDKNK